LAAYLPTILLRCMTRRADKRRRNLHLGEDDERRVLNRPKAAV
jgi:hypothetical protein